MPGERTIVASREKPVEPPYKKYRVDQSTVLVLNGEIDIAAAPTLSTLLLGLSIAGVSHLVIDMDAVTFLDSSGLDALVGAYRRIQTKGGVLEIVCTQGHLLDLFRVVGLDTVLGVHPSIEPVLSRTSAFRAALSLTRWHRHW